MQRRTAFVVALVAVVFVAAFTAMPAAEVTKTQQLFVIKELKPGLAKVGVLLPAASAGNQSVLQDLNKAAAAAGVKIFVAPVAEIKDVAPKFRDLVRSNGVQAIWVPEGTGILGDKTSRKFLITNATQSKLPLLAPSSAWVNEGATLTLTNDGAGIQLVVNKAAAEALTLRIPDKYKDRTQFLAAN